MNALPRPRVLFVDDEEAILQSLKRQFRRAPFDVSVATDPRQALELLRENPCSLIVSDHRMPGMTGVELLRAAREQCPEVPRIMLTGYADLTSAIQAVNEGSISRFMTKPWKVEELDVAIRQAIAQFELRAENARLEALTRAQNRELKELNLGLESRVAERTASIEALNRRLKHGFMEVVKVLGLLGQMDDPEASGRVKRVALLASGVARELGLGEGEQFQILAAAYLMEVGSLARAKLVETSAARHVEIARVGSELVAVVPPLQEASMMLKHVHERFDGSGAPDKLTGEAIPLGARIIAVCLRYDQEMRAEEGAGRGNATKSLALVREEARKGLDPRVVDSLAKSLDKLKALKREDGEVRIPTAELLPGMVLSRPLNTRTGRTMLGLDYRLDADMLERLRKLHEEDPLEDEASVYARSVPEKKRAKA